MKQFEKVKVANTKFEKEINYFGSLDSIYVDGEIHNVGSRVLVLCVLTDKDGWKNRINFQEGLSFSGDIGRRAGNSGNSTEPHLHYQLQGSSGLLDGLGLPAQFLEYYEDSVFVERGEPVRNQRVRKN